MTYTIIGAGKARRLAREIAAIMLREARRSEEPVVWMTGNAMMPPLRNFPQAERVWQCDNGAHSADEFAGPAIWQVLVDELEHQLILADVFMSAPDYDNALYVVDTSRWFYREDPYGEEISDDWHPAGALGKEETA